MAFKSESELKRSTTLVRAPPIRVALSEACRIALRRFCSTVRAVSARKAREVLNWVTATRFGVRWQSSAETGLHAYLREIREVGDVQKHINATVRASVVCETRERRRETRLDSFESSETIHRQSRARPDTTLQLVPPNDTKKTRCIKSRLRCSQHIASPCRVRAPTRFTFARY